MIHGRLIDRKAIVPVVFRLLGQPDFSLNFVVDTAFNGYLTLPVQAVSAMNLPLHSSTPIKLADGSESLTAIHLATVVWDGIEKVVLIMENSRSFTTISFESQFALLDHFGFCEGLKI
jgi:clan AA aspartic protease